MADPGSIFSGAGSGQGSLFSGANSGLSVALLRPPEPKPSEPSFGGALLRQIEGIPEGLKTLGGLALHGQLGEITHQLANQYWRVWGPAIAHGDLGETAHQIKLSPLSLADPIALAGGFLGIAGKASRFAAPESQLAKALTESGMIEVKAPSGQSYVRPTSNRPLRKAVQLATDKALKQLPENTPSLGEFRRAANAAIREVGDLKLARDLQARDFAVAYAHLSAQERVAVDLLADVPLHDLREAWRQNLQGKQVPTPALDDEEVAAHLGAPSSAIHSVAQLGRDLDEKSTQLLASYGALGVEGAETRRFMPMLILDGARVISRETPMLVPAKGKTIDTMIADLKTRIAAQGLDPSIYPFYRPHTSAVADAVMSLGGRRGGVGGLSANPRPPSSLRKSEGILFQLGRVVMGEDTITPAWLAKVRWANFVDRHQELLKMATRLPGEAGDPIRVPKGWSLLKSRPIPYTVRTLPDFEEHLDRVFPLDERRRPPDLTTKEIKDAALDEGSGRPLILPDHVIKRVAGSYLGTDNVLVRFLTRATDVWRYFVLNLAPRWLTNNLVGTHLLYLAGFLGPAGMRAYANAVLTSRGPAALRRMLSIKDPDAISDAFMREFFPRQVSGTGVGTQIPKLGSRLPGVQKVLGSLATFDRMSEGGIRRAAVEHTLRKSPEVKAIFRSMPEQTRNFELAARQAIPENPHLLRRVNDQVESAIGDFLSLGPFEKAVVRRLFPFYAWYRAITLVVLKMPLDSPIRTGLLEKIGQIGQDRLQDEFQGPYPGFLGGSLVLSGVRGGRLPIVNLTNTLPYSTVPQILGGISGFVSGRPGEGAGALGSSTNPLFQAAVEQLTGRDLLSGAPVRTQIAGIPSFLERGLPGVGARFIADLPQPRVLTRGLEKTPPGSLYGARTLATELAALAGVRKANVLVSKAHELAKRRAR